jgi:hypothetical protein
VHQVWVQVRQWKAVFEEFGANGRLIDQLASAFRSIKDIASPALETQIRRCTAPDQGP